MTLLRLIMLEGEPDTRQAAVTGSMWGVPERHRSPQRGCGTPGARQGNGDTPTAHSAPLSSPCLSSPWVQPIRGSLTPHMQPPAPPRQSKDSRGLFHIFIPKINSKWGINYGGVWGGGSRAAMGGQHPPPPLPPLVLDAVVQQEGCRLWGEEGSGLRGFQPRTPPWGRDSKPQSRELSQTRTPHHSPRPQTPAQDSLLGQGSQTSAQGPPNPIP